MVEEFEEVEVKKKLRKELSNGRRIWRSGGYPNWFKEVFKFQGPSHLFQKYAPSFNISILKSDYFEGNQNYYGWSFKMMNLL